MEESRRERKAWCSARTCWERVSLLVDTQANETKIGGSAAAAGSLVEKLGGTLVGYVFILELDFLKGRDKLTAPVHTLLSSQKTDTTSQ